MPNTCKSNIDRPMALRPTLSDSLPKVRLSKRNVANNIYKYEVNDSNVVCQFKFLIFGGN